MNVYIYISLLLSEISFTDLMHTSHEGNASPIAQKKKLSIHQGKPQKGLLEDPIIVDRSGSEFLTSVSTERTGTATVLPWDAGRKQPLLWPLLQLRRSMCGIDYNVSIFSVRPQLSSITAIHLLRLRLGPTRHGTPSSFQGYRQRSIVTLALPQYTSYPTL